MRARYNQLTEKYRSFRRRQDVFYHSRLIQTFFNKFKRRGHKRPQLLAALRALRCTAAYPGLSLAIIRILRRLHISMVIVPRRKGKQILSVPVPARRNKRDTLNLQLLYNAVSARRERTFRERFENEMTDLTFNYHRAPTHRSFAAHYANIFEERVNMEYRWK